MSKKSGSHHKSGSLSKNSGSKPKKSYPPEVREKAVKLITELGYSVGDVAQQLGCSTAAVRRWKTEATPPDPEVSLRMELGEDENKRLRKELARVKMENEILKKATAYFIHMTAYIVLKVTNVVVHRKTPATNGSGLLQRRGSVEPGCNALALPPGSTSVVRVGRSS